MSRQCHNPKCIGSKNRLTHKYKNKEEDPRPPSTSHRNSWNNTIVSRNKRTQKHTKLKSKRSRDDSKSLRASSNELRNYINKKGQTSRSISQSSTSSRKLCTTKSAKPKPFRQVSTSSRDYRKQICTCRKERRGTRSGNSHEHANLQSTPAGRRSERRRKRSRRRRKKTSARESDRPRRNCFATLCVCVRGRRSDELRACMSSHEISSPRECSSVKDRKKGKKLTRRTTLKNDTQVDGYTADPSTSRRKSVFKYSQELSSVKLKAEQNMIVKGFNTLRRGINRFGAYAIRLNRRDAA
ncbi:actin cytoskeleton-regulatory complex protein sla1-like isoform X2 [Pogonomyrmex barbatus]|uniref:Actin cytoskeleton-regulatory complex protein sla1-like isoform X2 n=1 Tax=Pogonomyrmex barbatus TaxID=144034 RepID=A0A8N1S7W0_9HYME|nr:actin cytoskeleton-regulatory complex protein sla1-like isoform X2 [Pogonomyrmex barbatus]